MDFSSLFTNSLVKFSVFFYDLFSSHPRLNFVLLFSLHIKGRNVIFLHFCPPVKFICSENQADISFVQIDNPAYKISIPKSVFSQRFSGYMLNFLIDFRPFSLFYFRKNTEAYCYHSHINMDGLQKWFRILNT